MSSPVYTIELIENNDAEVIKYEKGLYNAFSKRNKDHWLLKNYITKPDNRLAPCYDYLLFKFFVDGEEYSYAAVGKPGSKRCQYKDLGFVSAPGDKDIAIADGLNMFTIDNPAIKNSFKYLLELHKPFIEILKEHGFGTFYLSTSGKLESMYDIMGYERLQEIEYGNETEVLFRLPFEEQA